MFAFTAFLVAHPTIILYLAMALVYCAAARCAWTARHRGLAIAYVAIAILHLGVSACHSLGLG